MFLCRQTRKINPAKLTAFTVPVFPNAIGHAPRLILVCEQGLVHCDCSKCQIVACLWNPPHPPPTPNLHSGKQGMGINMFPLVLHAADSQTHHKY